MFFFHPPIAWTGFCSSTQVNTDDVKQVYLVISLEVCEIICILEVIIIIEYIIIYNMISYT